MRESQQLDQIIMQAPGVGVDIVAHHEIALGIDDEQCRGALIGRKQGQQRGAVRAIGMQRNESGMLALEKGAVAAGPGYQEHALHARNFMSQSQLCLAHEIQRCMTGGIAIARAQVHQRPFAAQYRRRAGRGQLARRLDERAVVGLSSRPPVPAVVHGERQRQWREEHQHQHQHHAPRGIHGRALCQFRVTYSPSASAANAHHCTA